jgi:hypothetical protein
VSDVRPRIVKLLIDVARVEVVARERNGAPGAEVGGVNLGHRRGQLLEREHAAVEDAPTGVGQRNVEQCADGEGLAVMGLERPDQLVVASQRRVLARDRLGLVQRQPRAGRGGRGPDGQRMGRPGQVGEQEARKQEVGAGDGQDLRDVGDQELEGGVAAAGLVDEARAEVEADRAGGAAGPVDQHRRPPRPAAEVERESGRSIDRPGDQVSRLRLVDSGESRQATARNVAISERIRVAIG